MPEFRWKARFADGREVEGRTKAASKEEVVIRLRSQGLLVTSLRGPGGAEEELPALVPGAVVPMPPEPAQSLTEELAHARATEKPHPFRGLLVAAGLVLAALLVGLLAPVSVYRCDRDDQGVVTCTLAERDLGVVPVWSSTLRGVTRSDVETRETVGSTRNHGTVTRTDYRLVLFDAQGASIRPHGWSGGDRKNDGAIGDSGHDMLQAVPDFLESNEARHVRVWHADWVPLVMPLVLLLLALMMAALSGLAFSASGSGWFYDRVGALAAAVDEKKRRR